MLLSSCPGLWPPSAVSSGLMHSHQHLLLGGACLHLVARPAHHDRHFFENRARPLPAFLTTAFLYYCLPFEAPSSYCDRRPRELARACPCGCVASVAVACLLLRATCDVGRRENREREKNFFSQRKKTCPRQRKSTQKGAPALGWRRGGRIVLSCLIDLATWIYDFNKKPNQTNIGAEVGRQM